MPSLRWPKVEHDLALVKEYTESSPSKPDEWDEKENMFLLYSNAKFKEGSAENTQICR